MQRQRRKECKTSNISLPSSSKKGGRHLLRDCATRSEQEKPALLEKSKAEKGAKNKTQGTKRVSSAEEDDQTGNSVTFYATYGDNSKDRFLADIGADANLAEK